MRYYQTNVRASLHIRVDLHHHHVAWKYVKQDVFLVARVLLEINPHSGNAMVPSDSRVMRNLSRWLSEAWLRSLEHKRPTQHSHVIANLNSGNCLIFTLNDSIVEEDERTADYCWAALRTLGSLTSLGDSDAESDSTVRVEVGRKPCPKLDQS